MRLNHADILSKCLAGTSFREQVHTYRLLLPWIEYRYLVKKHYLYTYFPSHFSHQHPP